MPTFDAGAVVESLDYDFTKAGVKAKGTIPEPTDQAIGQFMADIRDLMKEAQGFSEMADKLDLENVDPAEAMAALSDLDADQFVKLLAKMSAIYARLCSDRPRAEEIAALPLRVRNHFFAWIQKEVVNPEVGPAAGTAQVVTLPRAAGG